MSQRTTPGIWNFQLGGQSLSQANYKAGGHSLKPLVLPVNVEHTISVKIRKNAGFMAVETLLVLVALAIVALAGYYIYHTQKTHSATVTGSSSDESRSSSAPKAKATNVSLIPTLGSQSLTASLPDGWQKEQTDYLSKTIDGTTYNIDFTLAINSDTGNTDLEYGDLMGGAVSGGTSVLKTVRTAKGTSIAVVKTSQSVVLAACQPTGNNCYLQQDGQPLFVQLYVEGGQDIGTIDFSSSAASSAIADFEAIAASLSI